MSTAPGDFWSRRRAQVAAEEVAEARTLEAEAHAARDAQLDERPDDEILAELDLPAPEEMDSTEQVQTLLKSAVPQRLKTRALRRLWRLNPVLANVDGLVDYGEDFTDAATVIENMQTIYQVGKGMFDKAVEAAEAEARAEAQAQAKIAEQQDRPDADEAPDQVRGAAVSDAPVTADAQGDPVPAAAPGPHTVTEDDAPAPQTPRRMRFRFEAAT